MLLKTFVKKKVPQEDKKRYSTTKKVQHYDKKVQQYDYEQLIVFNNFYKKGYSSTTKKGRAAD